MTTTTVSFLGTYTKKETILRPLFLSPVPAGFPSPAEDFIDQALDLNELMIEHPSATYFVRVEGESMKDAGICSGDILIVDRSLQPRDQSIVVAALDGELTVKRMHMRNGSALLRAENESFDQSALIPKEELTIWGVVTGVVRKTL